MNIEASQGNPTELVQRVDHLLSSAIGLLNQWVFLLPLIQSKEIWNNTSRVKVRGLIYLKSTNLRYLILNVAALWQTENKNKKGEIIYLMNSIPGAQCRLPAILPKPEEYCRDARGDCVRDLRQGHKKSWESIRTIRDKSVAHSELTQSNDRAKLDPFSVSELELTVSNLESFAMDTLIIVDALNHVVRESQYCWDDSAASHRKVAEAFFGVSDFSLSIPELNISI